MARRSSQCSGMLFDAQRMSLHAYHCVADLQLTVRLEDVVSSLRCDEQAECLLSCECVCSVVTFSMSYRKSAVCGRDLVDAWWKTCRLSSNDTLSICTVRLCCVACLCRSDRSRTGERLLCAGCYKDMVGVCACALPCRLWWRL